MVRRTLAWYDWSAQLEIYTQWVRAEVHVGRQRYLERLFEDLVGGETERVSLWRDFPAGRTD